ncbi:hypothetical protein [Actinomadura sp. SCN-SB]|uniref:hypothetical protein n=1 Tax=Actinomadura sp. SCN-SB TaxID=3373092 RepID=UPI0037518B2B
MLKHVRVLEETGLVTTVKRGRVRECRLRDDALVADRHFAPVVRPRPHLARAARARLVRLDIR